MAAPTPTLEVAPEDTAITPVDDYFSWGRYPRAVHRSVKKIYWQDEIPRALRDAQPASMLAYGLGRSYGDVCLNDGRDLIDVTGCNRILGFDAQTGVIRAEAGVSLGELLEVIVPRGWFLPVTPGTKFVTIGGAIANDVHGKNHHRAGTMGCHVNRLLLYRSDCGPVVCSPTENADMFAATVGGLGLTGVIGWAELRLKKVSSALIDAETILFRGMKQFLQLCSDSDAEYEHTVAWVDCFSGKNFRGVFFRGNHSERQGRVRAKKSSPGVPFDFPEWLLSGSTIRLFNSLYYTAQKLKPRRATIHYDPFFYPLDSVPGWSRVYGRRGMLQYQCVLPEEHADALEHMMALITSAGHGSFLAVLKKFGPVTSPGIMSFPRPGLTYALDFPMRGERTLRLLDRLDEIVSAAGGAIYAAKDARMSPEMFQASYPRWQEMRHFLDEKFSSSLWRRVTGA